MTGQADRGPTRDWDEPPGWTWWRSLLSVVGGAVIAAAADQIAGILAERRATATVRERVLAVLGADLVAARDREAIFAAALRAVRVLAGGEPDLVLRIFRVRDAAGDLQVAAATGGGGGSGDGAAGSAGVVGAVLPRDDLPGQVLLALDGGPDSVVLPAVAVPPVLGRHPPPGVLLAVPMRSPNGTRGLLTVSSPGSLPPTLPADAVAVARQVNLALESTRLLADSRALQRRLAEKVYLDHLTGLPNRYLLLRRLREALAAPGHKGIALLMVELDGVRAVNDALGQPTGDDALVRAGRRLRAVADDRGTAARLDGVVFALLLTTPEGAGMAGVVAGQVVDAFRAPLRLAGGREAHVRAVVGVAAPGPTTRTPEDLLLDAALALRHARENGGGYRLFRPELRAAALDRLELEADLRQAVRRGELVLHYQPVVYLADGTPRGVEALVRWNHPRRGLLPPDRFIPLAEATGLIGELGEWVLREACRQGRAWEDRRPPDTPRLSMAVNLAPGQLDQPGIVGQVERALADSGLNPGVLILEITERELVRDTEATLARLRALRDLGVRLAVDDFGTGFSALAYLRRYPLTTLKIDRSFVQGADRDPRAAAVARAIVDVARALGLTTLAEGLETPAQLAAFRELGCDLGQGFLIARPADAERTGDWLGRRWRRSLA